MGKGPAIGKGLAIGENPAEEEGVFATRNVPAMGKGPELAEGREPEFAEGKRIRIC